jgi:hypothetical protein
MKRNIGVLVLFLCLTACSSATQAAEAIPTLSPTVTLEEIALPTVTSTRQPSSTLTAIPSTPTPLPSATPTPYPTPAGLLTRQALDQRIQDWIQGNIEFSDADRLLDEKTATVLRLGVLDEDKWKVVFIFYNLGFSVIEDGEGTPYLINVVGFEDGQGTRFTAVVHNGRLYDQEAIVRLVQSKGRRINHTEGISFEELRPEEFAGIAVDLPLSVFGGSTRKEGSTGKRAWNEYLDTAKDATNALTEFLTCNQCSVEQDVPVILKPIINRIPEEYNTDIPCFYDYHVSYW